jgi:hypothetical protein
MHLSTSLHKNIWSSLANHTELCSNLICFTGKQEQSLTQIEREANSNFIRSDYIHLNAHWWNSKEMDSPSLEVYNYQLMNPWEKSQDLKLIKLIIIIIIIIITIAGSIFKFQVLWLSSWTLSALHLILMMFSFWWSTLAIVL